MKNLPASVRIVEVGPRDGLQNEALSVSVADRIDLVNQLSHAGFRAIETGSFVSSKWVPQMEASGEVFAGIHRQPDVRYSALTPNLQGLESAQEADVDEVAVFAAASESFSQRNINCSIDESMKRFQPLIEQARQHDLPVRGYVSCVIGCPYEGKIDPAQVATVTESLLNMGCYEVSLGDTIGTGTPSSISRMLDEVLKSTSVDHLALHCHDTYGQALVNIHTGLGYGINVVDSSVAGLGGCPYAKGASGNVATEDLLYLLDGLGIKTGVDLALAIKAGNFISSILGRPNLSKVAQAQSQTEATQS